MENKKEFSADVLQKFAQADDLHISPFRDDGITFGTPTWIWSVVVGESLYVRAYNGSGSRWNLAAVKQKAGKISVAGMRVDVSFEPVSGDINDAIDDAYKEQYSGSPYLASMISARAKAATIEIHPA